MAGKRGMNAEHRTYKSMIEMASMISSRQGRGAKVSADVRNSLKPLLTAIAPIPRRQGHKPVLVP